MEYTKIKTFYTPDAANKWLKENQIVATSVSVICNRILIAYTEFEPLDIDENYELTLDDLLEDGDLF